MLAGATERSLVAPPSELRPSRHAESGVHLDAEATGLVQRLENQLEKPEEIRDRLQDAVNGRLRGWPGVS